MSDYFKQRKLNTLKRLRALREELPHFCSQFFSGVENQTTELTRLNYAYDLRLFFHFLSKTKKWLGKGATDFTLSDLGEVTADDIERFLEWLTCYRYNGYEYTNEERGKARKLSTLRTMFGYFFNKGQLNSNIASRVQTPKIREKEIVRLEVDEVALLLDTADTGDGLSKHSGAFHKKTKERDVAMLTLLLGTGIRISELVGLNLDDIDFNSNAFTVKRKGGHSAILYFSPEVAQALGEYIQQRNSLKDVIDENALFLSLQKKRLCVRAVQNIVKKYSRIVTPLKNISPHKLRSTYGTELYRASGDIYMVADVLGHKDVNTTKKHYAAITDEHRRKAANLVILREEKD